MLIGLLLPVAGFASPIGDASKYSVRVKSTVQYAFAEEEAGTGEGAGFLIDKVRGWILTNAHVSGYGTGDIEVSFKGQDFVPVDAVYVDPELDFAVLKVDKEYLPQSSLEAELECSDRALNGLEVAAFGHPHGLNYSASRGIISQVRYFDGVDWVQTDAAINPGNSGGPLIDLESGKIVGINAMKLEDTEGLNFAVPSLPVCKILELMEQNKDPSPPVLPMSFAVNEDTEEYLIVAPSYGGTLPNGMKLGDRVTKIGGVSVSTPTEIKTLLRGMAGETQVVVARGDSEAVATIKIVKEPKILERQYVLADGALIAKDVYPERWALENYFHVQSVREGSYAERVGWVQYRLIVSIDGVRPDSLEHIKELLSGDEPKTIIFRGWSSQDNKMHDYHEVDYWPIEVILS